MTGEIWRVPSDDDPDMIVEIRPINPTLIFRMCCYTCGEEIDDDRWFAQCAGCSAAAARQRSAELLRQVLAEHAGELTITYTRYYPGDE